MKLNTVQFERGQEFPIRHCLDAVPVATDPYEFFHMGVPWCNFIVVYGPLWTIAVFFRGLEFVIAPTLTGPSPGQGFSAHLITPDPIKGLFLYIGMIIVLDKEMGGVLPKTGRLGNQRVCLKEFL